MIDPRFTLAETRKAIAQGQLSHWLENYLTLYNPGLRDGLRQVPRYWFGPEKIRLEKLIRCCGPEPEMEYRANQTTWERKVETLVTSFKTLEDFPPVIGMYKEGILSLRDGSHRHETFRRLELEECWALVWYNSAADVVQGGRGVEEALLVV